MSLFSDENLFPIDAYVINAELNRKILNGIYSATHCYDVTFSARRVYTTSGHFGDKDFANARLTSFFFIKFHSSDEKFSVAQIWGQVY